MLYPTPDYQLNIQFHSLLPDYCHSCILILEMFSRYFDPQVGHIICNFESINIIHHKSRLLPSYYSVAKAITMTDGRVIYGTNFSDWGGSMRARQWVSALFSLFYIPFLPRFKRVPWWMEGEMGWWMDGGMDGWTDGRMDQMTIMIKMMSLMKLRIIDYELCDCEYSLRLQWKLVV